jgi:hypothetical protein
LFLDSIGDDTMRIITLAVGGAILFALTAMDSADAARICKDGHFYYGGGDFHHNRVQAEASAVRAWRAIQAQTHGAIVAANLFPPSGQMRCARAVGHEGWRCFVRGGPCHAA